MFRYASGPRTARSGGWPYVMGRRSTKSSSKQRKRNSTRNPDPPVTIGDRDLVLSYGCNTIDDVVGINKI